MRAAAVGVALAGLVLIAVSPISAQKGRPKLTEVSGDTTIACVDQLARVGSSGDGVCSDVAILYHDGFEGMDSDLREGDREFRLWHYPSSGRHLRLRFPFAEITPRFSFECFTCTTAGRVLSRVVATNFGTDFTNAGANTNLVTTANVEVAGGLTSIPVDANPLQPQKSRFLIGFPDPDGQPYRWSIYFNPAAYPGTDLVDVRRTGACTWTISTGTSAIGGLKVFGYARGKGGSIAEYEGRYSMPFSMTFTAASCN